MHRLERNERPHAAGPDVAYARCRPPFRPGAPGGCYVEAAGAVVFARCPHHHPAGGYAPEAILEAGNVLGNNCEQGLARLHSLKVDLDGALHTYRPTGVPFRTLRTSSRTGREHPPGDRAAAAFPADTRPYAYCAGERLPRAGPPSLRACRRRDRAKPGPPDRPARPRSTPR